MRPGGQGRRRLGRRRGPPPWGPAAALGGAAVLTAAAAALAGRALWREPRDLRLRHVRLRLPRWPEALDGFRLAVVSDLHAGSPHADAERLREVVEAVDEAGPDLVVLLGDFVDATPRADARMPPATVAARLAGLRAPLGVYAVLGNHDWRHDGEAVRAALHREGIAVLENDAVPRGRPPRRLWLLGVADATERTPSLAPLDDLPGEEPVILLSHHPDLFPRVPDRVALTLSGHTHGGQVDVPLLRRWLIPSRFGDRYRAGHVVEGGRHLYVTRGVGTTGAPVRFRSPPEVVLLELAPARARLWRGAATVAESA